MVCDLTEHQAEKIVKANKIVGLVRIRAVVLDEECSDPSPFRFS